MNLILAIDADRLLRLCDLLLFASKRTKAAFNLRYAPLELIGFDVSHGSAGAGKTTVRVIQATVFLTLCPHF
jgi:hypothetical protein